MTTRSYGVRIPGMPREKLTGKLIVVEGADGSGRTTEVGLLREWLEIQGHAVVDTGLRRSSLLSEKIDEAKRGNTLGATTLALFYAADFADQLENKIVPSLAAGSTVLADRYIYTLMARAIVRGASREWAQRVYGFALQPDLVIFLEARPDILLHRAIAKYGSLDYWESGMDLSLSRDRFESFFRYQELLRREFDWMREVYRFQPVDANRIPLTVHQDVRRRVAPLYGFKVEPERAHAPRAPERTGGGVSRNDPSAASASSTS